METDKKLRILILAEEELQRLEEVNGIHTGNYVRLKSALKPQSSKQVFRIRVALLPQYLKKETRRGCYYALASLESAGLISVEYTNNRKGVALTFLRLGDKSPLKIFPYFKCDIAIAKKDSNDV
jgi:hypothetical protein